MTYFTDEKLAELEKICGAATPGKWERDAGDDCIKAGCRAIIRIFFPLIRASGQRETEESYANFRLVEAAHEDFPKALVEIRRLRKLNSEMLEGYRYIAKGYGILSSAGVIARDAIKKCDSPEETK